jgi:hypothetical protein
VAAISGAAASMALLYASKRAGGPSEEGVPALMAALAPNIGMLSGGACAGVLARRMIGWCGGASGDREHQPDGSPADDAAVGQIAFSALDRDGDGKVTKEDFGAASALAGPVISALDRVRCNLPAWPCVADLPALEPLRALTTTRHWCGWGGAIVGTGRMATGG